MKATLRTVRLMRDDDAPRAFTPADKALIRRVHGYMPAQQLLDLLNERLVADLGPDETQYTMAMIQILVGILLWPMGLLQLVLRLIGGR